MLGSAAFSENDERENCVFQFFARDLEMNHFGGYDILIVELIEEHMDFH